MNFSSHRQIWSKENGQVAAVCATHSSLRLSLVHFNLASAEYRSAQLFTLTYQWQPLQYDPHRPPTHTHSTTCHTVSTHTHLLRDRDTFPSTHKNLTQHMLPYRPQLSVNMQNKPRLPTGWYILQKRNSLFSRNPSGLAAQGNPSLRGAVTGPAEWN